MGKYVANVPATTPDQKPPAVCHVCGWCFDVDNEKKILYDLENSRKYRKQPRTEINTRNEPRIRQNYSSRSDGPYLTWCHVCYEKHLMSVGMHSSQAV